MSSTVIGELVIGVVFGLFFIVLGVLQLATGTLYTGGRGRSISADKGSPLLWVFAPLEILVGLAALALTGWSGYRAAMLDGSCDNRKNSHVCVEYRGHGDLKRAQCGAVIRDTGCDQDNLLGRCAVTTKGGVEKTHHYYSDKWTETREQRAAECAKLGGKWDR